jgi:hypothetical protein
MTLAGYGCAGPSATPSWLQTPEIHLGSAKVMNAPTHPGPIADDFGVLSKSYVFSDPTAMLCPGDSGGPALIKRGGQWAVAGVASGYTVVDGKVTANWHASVDGQAKFHPHRGGLGMVGSKPKETTVADWLVSEGVDVIH